MSVRAAPVDAPAVALGLRANAPQFALLVVLNAFVGAMVGVERSALPIVGREAFGLAVVNVGAFVVAFGAAKAVANLAAGRVAERAGRRRTLLAGWALALPVPLVLWLAPAWEWIVAANLLLGVSQGLAWTMTVLMKMDLAGPARRGLATALNEFAGYLGVGLAAYVAAGLARAVDPRAGPSLVGLGIALVGLALAVVVRDTGRHAALDDEETFPSPAPWWRRAAVYQAGFAKNANDAVAWALVPLFLAARGADLPLVGLVTGLYPVTWSVGQLAVGPLTDRFGRRAFVVAGMLVQAVAMLGLLAAARADVWVLAAVGWGAGTAMVYPTLLAAAADLAPAEERPRALGVYRFFRDSGLVAGALGGGLIATASGLDAAIAAGAAVTAASGALALGLRR